MRDLALNIDKPMPGWQTRSFTPPDYFEQIQEDPGYAAESIDFTTTEMVQARLRQAGFEDFVVTTVPHKDNLPWNIDWVMVEA